MAAKTVSPWDVRHRTCWKAVFDYLAEPSQGINDDHERKGVAEA